MKWLWALPASLLLFFGTGLAASELFRNKRIPHQKTPRTYDIPFNVVNIPAEKNGMLYGWWIAGKAGRPTIILVHGWNNNLGRFMPFIRSLHEFGYNLLAFDARGHGNSSDLNHPTVWTFSEDVLSAARFIEENRLAEDSPIGVIGHSIGGGAAINAAAMNNNLQAVIALGAFAHPIDVMRADLKARHIPYFPFAWIIFHYWQRLRHIDFDRIAPSYNISLLKGDVLLIHGSKDTQVPVYQARELERNADPERTELWVLEEYGHNDCHHHPDFWQRITVFIDKTCDRNKPQK